MQLSVFPRATAGEQIQQTIDSFNAYAADYRHWQISFSGGKDSTTLVTLTLDLIERGLIPRPKTLTVMYADTRMELPPLHASAMGILKDVRRRGWDTQVVMAPLDKRFLVYMLGRGVPAPNNSTMRWCTGKIKLEPMKEAMLAIHAKYGEKILSLNGVRLGESAVRDNRISVSCSKNGSECGQGWFQRDLPDAVCDKLSPILHWRVCSVWDWLMLDAPKMGFNTELLAEVYGGDEATEINARTGCIGCPLTQRDMALEGLIQLQEWKYLEPLSRLREVYAKTRLFSNRHKKVGERNKTGNLSANPSRVGCLSLDARRRLIKEVIEIQDNVNSKAELLGRPKVDFLNNEERDRINELIELRTFPQGWTGDEPLGNEVVAEWYHFSGIEVMQPALW